MDVVCPRCGEPWDFDTMHDEAEARFDAAHPDLRIPQANRGTALREEYSRLFAQVSGEFRTHGCVALAHCGGSPCTARSTERTAVANAAYELLGDDMDGAASLMEDYLQ